MGHGIGMALGLMTGIAVGIVVVVLLFKKKVFDCTFDERQERARGVAFKYGFFTLMAALLAYGTSELTLGRWCDAMAGGCLCLALGISVFAVTCILKDAYLSLREKPRQVMTLSVLIAAGNLCIGLVQLRSGHMMEDGVLTFRSTNLIVGAMMLAILAVYLVNYLLRDRDGEAG